MSFFVQQCSSLSPFERGILQFTSAPKYRFFSQFLRSRQFTPQFTLCALCGPASSAKVQPQGVRIAGPAALKSIPRF